MFSSAFANRSVRFSMAWLGAGPALCLRLARAGLRWDEPARIWDVDDAADLARLRSSGLMDDWFLENDR